MTRERLDVEPIRVSGHVGGAFVKPTGAELDATDPTTGHRIAILHESDTGEVDRAVGLRAMFTETKTATIPRERRSLPRIGLS